MKEKMKTVAATVAAIGITILGGAVCYANGVLIGNATIALAEKAVKKILGTENEETNEE